MDVDVSPKEAYLAVGDFDDTQIAMAQARGLTPRQLLGFVDEAKDRKRQSKYRHPDGQSFAKRFKTEEGGRKTRRTRKNKKRQQKKSRRNNK